MDIFRRSTKNKISFSHNNINHNRQRHFSIYGSLLLCISSLLLYTHLDRLIGNNETIPKCRCIRAIEKKQLQFFLRGL
jgi:hypothetical protein